MLHGDRITLRPIRAADLDAAYDAHTNIANRGAFFPLGVTSEPPSARCSPTAASGRRSRARSSSQTPEGEIAGHIEFFRPIVYWDACELSYQLYDDRFAGKGYTTEAVQLLVDYLFGAKKPNRIQLVIVPENAASRRIAEKCGFTLEGTARGAFFNGGTEPGPPDLLAPAGGPPPVARDSGAAAEPAVRSRPDGTEGGAEAVRAAARRRSRSLGGELLGDGLVRRHGGRFGSASPRSRLLAARAASMASADGLRGVVLLLAAGQHLDRRRDDLGLPVAQALVVVPRPGLEAALERDLLALAEVAPADLGEAVPGDDVVELAAVPCRCRRTRWWPR